MNCLFFTDCQRIDPHVHCVVPHCTRTAGGNRIAPWTEWICHKHWAGVPKAMRRVKNRVHRLVLRRPSIEDGIKLAHRNARIWRRIKQIAINRAVGI